MRTLRADLDATILSATGLLVAAVPVISKLRTPVTL